MCGIFGIINGKVAAPEIVGGLKRLEYRGYDSAGIATVHDGRIDLRRAAGKLSNLAEALNHAPAGGTMGIGHTRWATHGGPNESNAHPHVEGRVAVVHNGIIENFADLRAELQARGHAFRSQTDTEVIPHLVSENLAEGLDILPAIRKAVACLKGSYAIGVVSADDPNTIFAARRGSPLAVGACMAGDGAVLASDVLALAGHCREARYLEDGDIAVLKRDRIEILADGERPTERPAHRLDTMTTGADKRGFRHFMAKEIFEQPETIAATLGAYFKPDSGGLHLSALPFDPANLDRLLIIGCGTSFYAGMIGRHWIEALAGLPVDLDIASEFRYRAAPLPSRTAALLISQSGETADTLAALRHLRERGVPTVAVVNVPTSSMAREADGVLHTHAGPEIGVASTKAFTAQLTVLACLAYHLARARGHVTPERDAALAEELSALRSQCNQALNLDPEIAKLAAKFMDGEHALYLGRGSALPLAFEGALKLKEISYIHAEGFGAGELKHGPIALVDDTVPAVVIAPPDALFEKTMSNMQEVAARGARVLVLSDSQGIENARRHSAVDGIALPMTGFLTTPIVYAVPLQLLAYHVALLKGNDVDQPRNLAKSVTVE